MSGSSPNERLRGALAARGLSTERVASELGVDPKTVARWLTTGRIPHSRHRRAAAELLDEDEDYLWPDAASAARTLRASVAELVSLYPHRADVPADLWPAFFARARNEIGLLVYAAPFLTEQYPDFVEFLGAKAGTGCRVRIALGDPNSAAVHARGEEEQFGEGIESRARVAMRHYEPLVGKAGVEVRLHDTTPYNSIYRSDNELLVNQHVWGANAYKAPVLHLRRVPGGRLFDVFVESFEAVWALGRPAGP